MLWIFTRINLIFRRKIKINEREISQIDHRVASDKVPTVARPKTERPATVPWPELGEGQAERLRWTREKLGWSLRDLAAASGVSTRTIRDIESGTKKGTSADLLAALADALHVSRGWLTFGG